VTDNRQTIRFLSSPDQLTEVDEAVESWLRKQDVPEDTISDLALVVSELVNNAIEHGNERDPEKKFTVVLNSRRGEIEISVTDEGFGFDPDDLPDPVTDENLLKPSGRGLFVVKSLVDQIQFSFPPEGGTTVIVSKKI
jgi:serine/threonine-protein kinase RsbW